MIDKLPFKTRLLYEGSDYKVLCDDDNVKYLLLELNQKQYSTYRDILKYSNNLSKSIYEIPTDEGIELIFTGFDEMTENKVKIETLLRLLEEIFNNSSYEINLKKEHLVNMNRMYQVLDRKFTYFEFRIREVETSPIKDDISWILLSKYNVVLDSKIILYDLQQDLFKLIDKEEIVKYGLLYRQINQNLYQKGKILPFFDLYYAPIGMMYCRYFLSFVDEIELDKFSKIIEKLDMFNQKYFCFMVLYILILNLNLDINLDINKISNYIIITKKMRLFMNTFSFVIKK